MQPKKYSEDYSKHSMDIRLGDELHKQSKHSKTPLEALDACRIRLRRAQGLVKPGAAGLLTGVEYSRVRDSAWMYLTSLVTTCLEVGLVDVQGNFPTSVE